jgi:hypothetical protein
LDEPCINVVVYVPEVVGGCDKVCWYPLAGALRSDHSDWSVCYRILMIQGFDHMIEVIAVFPKTMFDVV